MTKSLENNYLESETNGICTYPVKIGVNATILENNKPSGIGVFTFNIVNELAKAHSDLNVWTIDATHLRLNSRRCVEVFPVLRKIFKHKLFLFRTAWDQFVLPLLAAKAGCDVVFFPIPEGFLWSRFPQVLTVHDLHPILFSSEVPFYRNLSFRFRIPYLLRRADAVVAVSDNTKRDIIRTFGIEPDKIHVIHCGYDSSMFRPVQCVDSILGKYNLRGVKYVLYVGNIVRHKNVGNLVKAFVASNVASSLVICGAKKDPLYFEEIQATINQFGVGDRIIVLDYVEAKDLPALYSNATLFAFPSLHEGFGIPLLEAMACGAPVLTSNTSSIPDVVGDAAMIVDPTNVEDLALGIKLIFTDGTLRNTMRLKGLERVKLFSWKDSALKIERVCSDVLRHRRGDDFQLKDGES
jgi:glycosyltransferase involved in cell wall biosynthesis